MVVRLYSVMEIFSTILCMFYLNNRRFQFSLKNITIISLNVIFISAVNEFHLPHVYTMLFHLVLFMYCGWEFGFHIKQMLVNTLLSLLIMSIVQASGAVWYLILCPGKDPAAITYLMINIYSFLIILCGIKKLKIYRISQMLQQQDLLNFLALVFISGIMLIYLAMYKNSHSLNAREYLLLLVCVAYICFLTAIWKRYKNIALEKEIECKTQRIFSTVYQNMVEDIKARQHDFDNHLNTIISQHYTCHDYDSLVRKQREYMEQVENNNRYNKVLISGNSVIVGFLYGKFLEADKKQIQVIYKLDFRDLEWDVPDFRLIELIGNLFDNAVDAVLKGTLKKEIYVAVTESTESIHIEIGNVSPQIDRNQIALFFKKKYSKKGNTRGYGLYNVKNICSQYHIRLLCENELRKDCNWLVFKLDIPKPMCES